MKKYLLIIPILLYTLSCKQAEKLSSSRQNLAQEWFMYGGNCKDRVHPNIFFPKWNSYNIAYPNHLDKELFEGYTVKNLTPDESERNHANITKSVTLPRIDIEQALAIYNNFKYDNQWISAHIYLQNLFKTTGIDEVILQEESARMLDMYLLNIDRPDKTSLEAIAFYTDILLQYGTPEFEILQLSLEKLNKYWSKAMVKKAQQRLKTSVILCLERTEKAIEMIKNGNESLAYRYMSIEQSIKARQEQKNYLGNLLNQLSTL